MFRFFKLLGVNLICVLIDVDLYVISDNFRFRFLFLNFRRSLSVEKFISLVYNDYRLKSNLYYLRSVVTLFYVQLIGNRLYKP